MDSIDTIIIGGGQAGLALSRCLTDRDLEHLVLERGRVAERWHSERWDSLRLVTPNWMTRLPGHVYSGVDPDGFMTATEAAALLGAYASSFASPVREHTTVERVARLDDGFVVATDRGCIRCRAVVVATGWCDRPAIPAEAVRLSGRVHQVAPSTYRNPDDLPDGGVLVVGASATGVQLADELHRSGRPVTLAVGSHTRMPRQHRGIDAFWWMDRLRTFDGTVDDVDDIASARAEPSLQLVGRPDHRTLDLTTLQAIGVRLVGRVRAIDGERVGVADDLAATVATADRGARTFLERVDAAVTRLGLDAALPPPEPLTTVAVVERPTAIDLADEGITSVVWATGFRRRYDWLELPVLDERGEIRQRRGVTPIPGAYVLGQRFQHFRNSNFIDGVGRDAESVADHIRQSGRSPSTRPRTSARGGGAIRAGQ